MAHLGVPLSDEHRRAISEGMKAKWRERRAKKA